MKQEVHTRLLKLCGGGGNHGTEPPSKFVPYDMMSEDKCAICKKTFNCENYLKDHIKTDHKIEVKRAFSKEARCMWLLRMKVIKNGWEQQQQ